MSREYKYIVIQPGDMSAGIYSKSDNVSVIVESGDPGGMEGEFQEWMQNAISEWFDGAHVYPDESAEVQA